MKEGWKRVKKRRMRKDQAKESFVNARNFISRYVTMASLGYGRSFITFKSYASPEHTALKYRELLMSIIALFNYNYWLTVTMFSESLTENIKQILNSFIRKPSFDFLHSMHSLYRKWLETSANHQPGCAL